MDGSGRLGKGSKWVLLWTGQKGLGLPTKRAGTTHKHFVVLPILTFKVTRFIEFYALKLHLNIPLSHSTSF